MFCEKCGAQMSDQQVTCEACGWSAQEQAPAVQEAQPIPQSIPVEETPAKKKVWPKIVFPIIAVVVAAIVALAILQPFGSDKDVVGKWQGDVDLTQAYNEAFSQQLGGVTFTDLKMTLILEFKDDHTISMQYDGDSAEKLANTMIDQMIPAIEQNSGVSIEQLLAAENLTEEEWRRQMIDQMKVSLEEGNKKMLSSTQNATWSVENGKVYLGNDKSSYMEITDDTMKMVYDKETAVGELSDEMNDLPNGVSADTVLSLFEDVVFTRVNE